MKNLTKISIALLLLLQLTAGQLARADVPDDPSTLPLPDFTIQTAQRAVVIKVLFNSATDIVVQSISVANTAAPGAAGKPSIILLESLDENNELINARNAWNPLWETNWDENGVESGQVLSAGAGTFYVPLVANMKSIRISDLTLEQEVLTVDVSAVVADYCTANSAAAVCVGFLSTDSCLPNPCQNGGVCTTELVGYSCGCVPGYFGDKCTTDLNECSAGLANCSANAYCSNTPGSFSCHCNSGYHGDGMTCNISDLSLETPPPPASSSGWGMSGIFPLLLVIPLWLGRRLMRQCRD